MNEKQAYQKLYGNLIYSVEFYYPKPSKLQMGFYKMMQNIGSQAIQMGLPRHHNTPYNPFNFL